MNISITSGKLKTVYVGKNRYPISIMQLAEVLEIVWKRKACFDLIAPSVGSLIGGHSMSYLITLVDNYVPIDTYYALKYVEKK